jgi:hypothetical protein
MDREDWITAYCNSGYAQDEAETLADDRVLADMAEADARRQRVLDELEILSRHLADPEGNPL